MLSTSILRWSGSKAKLVPLLSSLAPKKYSRYVEPFAGSACLFFSLKPPKAVLGDVNHCVMDVFRAIKFDPNGLSDILENIPRTREAFYLLRPLNPDNLTLPQRAARLIFLMKACFNGVYRTNRLGNFNVPMGNRVYALPSRAELLHASDLLRDTDLIAGDFTETIAQSAPGDWVYLDPPYRKPGRYRGEYGYSGKFDDASLSRFAVTAKLLAAEGRFVTISHEYDEQLLSEFGSWRVHKAFARRTVAGATASRQDKTELIFTSY